MATPYPRALDTETLADLGAHARMSLADGVAPPTHGHQEHHGALVDVRTATHRGREISVTTTYEFRVGGEPVTLHAFVGEDGKVRCHGIPYEGFSSALDLLRRTVDRYPDAFSTTSNEHGGQH